MSWVLLISLFHRWGKEAQKLSPNSHPVLGKWKVWDSRKLGEKVPEWERMQKEEEVLERVHFLCRSGCVGVRREDVESNMSTWVSPPTVTVT